jgi:hypothetical protein
MPKKTSRFLLIQTLRLQRCRGVWWILESFNYNYFELNLKPQGVKFRMPVCLQCNSQVSDESVYCGNCGAAINSPAAPAPTSQNQMAQGSNTLPNTADGDVHVRLEKAMRRTELLSYAAAGLGLAILFAIIGIAFV